MKLSSILMVALISVFVQGCNFSVGSGNKGEEISHLMPEEGKGCTIQFRRDALGSSRDLPVPPMTGSMNGAEVSVSGTFLRMDKDWVVIKYRDNNRELWIPRNMILLMSIQ